MRKLYLVLMGILLATLLMSGCGQDKAGQSEGKTLLKIGALSVEDVLPFTIADQNGYFAEENLQVELIPFQSAVEKDGALQSGQLDGVITDLIVTALLVDSGIDVKVTTLTSGATPEEGRFAILAAPGKGIQQVSDLKGKSIAVSTNTIIEYVTDGLLKEGGLEPEDVEKTLVTKIPARMEMLLNGQVDAAVFPDPLVSFGQFKGAKIVAEDTSSNLSQVVLVMSGKAIGENQEAMQGLFKAYSKAVNDYNSSPEKYRELLVEKANVPQPIQDEYQLPHFPLPQLPKEEEVEQVLDWLNAKGLLKKEINYDALVAQGLY